MSVRPVTMFYVLSITVLAMGSFGLSAIGRPEIISEVQQARIVGGQIFKNTYCAIAGGSGCTQCMPGMCYPGTLTTSGPQTCLYSPGVNGTLNLCYGSTCLGPVSGGPGCTTVPNCGGGSAVIPPAPLPNNQNSRCTVTATTPDGLQIISCGGPGPCVLGGSTVCNTCI